MVCSPAKAHVPGPAVVRAATLAVLIGGLLPPLVAQERASGTASLTVVPPGPVSNQVEVELRSSVTNGAAEARRFELSWHVDRAGKSELVKQVTAVVPGGKSAFHAAWLSTSGRTGDNRIRLRVTCAGARVAEKEWPLSVVHSKTRALPVLQGGWLDPLGLSSSVYARSREATTEDVRRMLRSLRELGMRVVIVTYVEYFGHFFYPTDITFRDRDVGKTTRGQWFGFDVVETVLSEAERQGMHVFLGLGRGGDTQLLGQGLSDARRLSAAVKLSKQVARDLWDRYGRQQSFYGWYLTHETNDLHGAAAYYNPVADFCHSLCSDKPVMVAPAGSPNVTRDVLSRSSVDIFAYQDAVGAGYEPGRYTYDPETRLAVLGEVYERYRRAHRGTSKHLWADLELWQMDGPNYEKPHAASFDRVKRQLEIEARHVAMLTSYEVTGFLQDPSVSLQLDDERAARLYRDYEAYLTAGASAPDHP